jgi:hypothetical protein
MQVSLNKNVFVIVATAISYPAWIARHSFFNNRIFYFLVNNCVGLLNYRYFCNFILSSAILCFITLAGCAVASYLRWDTYKDDPGLYFAHNIPSFFIGFLSLMLSFTLSSFWFYHCGLAMSGATTREDIKFRKHSKENESPRGSRWKNLIISWCGPLQTSSVDFDCLRKNFI